MKEFMQTHKIYLTPISPIHIGCGEDFEPTNYVIKNENLYCFEASKLGLSKQHRDDLIKICKDITPDSIQAIQAFFAKEDIIELAVKNAHSVFPVSRKIQDEWKNKLGKSVQSEGHGKKVFNILGIARNSYLPYCNRPYIPGSSLKGAVITSILDSANRKDTDKAKFFVPNKPEYEDREIYNEEIINLNADLIKRYIGDFSKLENADKKILSQQIKFSDFIPVSDNQELSKVIYAVNVKKILGKDRNAIKNLNVRRECIQPMKFRAFCASLTLLNENNSRELDLTQLIGYINEFNFPILKNEYQNLIENGVCNNKNYVENVKMLLERKNIALIRLGRSGSEAKVYSDPNLRSIAVRGIPSKESHTLWVASDLPGKSETMQPFGWALLEFMHNEEENTLLQTWCQKPGMSVHSYQQKLTKERKDAEEQKAKEEALNVLSENRRKVIELKDKFNASNEKQIDSSSALLKEVRILIENEAINWNKEDKQFMAEHITEELIVKRVELKKRNANKDLNKLLNKLVVE